VPAGAQKGHHVSQILLFLQILHEKKRAEIEA
jgi:hypothetical protein